VAAVVIKVIKPEANDDGLRDGKITTIVSAYRFYMHTGTQRYLACAKHDDTASACMTALAE
jgi:hypothetical protein